MFAAEAVFNSVTGKGSGAVGNAQIGCSVVCTGTKGTHDDVEAVALSHGRSTRDAHCGKLNICASGAIFDSTTDNGFGMGGNPQNGCGAL